jgi:hypothetical protein
VVLLWLVGVVPAGVFTCLRGRWLLFWCGLPTGGALWFIGALVPDPNASSRQRHQAAIGLGVTVGAFVVLGLFGARPTPVLGINGGALQNSVGALFLEAGSTGCERKDGDWICSRYERELSGNVPYRVHVNRVGCWQGTRIGSWANRSPKEISGCASLVDFVFD